MSDAVGTAAPERRRFELHVGGELVGWADYLPAGESVILAHTEVLDGHEGEGLGGLLVRSVLEQLRARGTTVIPTCPFAAAWIHRHPEYAADVAPALRGQFAG
ncbi:MAG: N-acetyltransferase [Solirubrobacterales bacterium]|nr:N-acetyltransferase [Solirubrobacterales bacterium]